MTRPPLPDDHVAPQMAPQLWDRLLDATLRPWRARLSLVDGATAEISDVVRRARRLAQLDADVERSTRMRDEARRDLVALERRAELAIQEAVAEAEKAAFRRTAKVAAARERAEAWQEEHTGPTRRAIRSRLATAERELARINQERTPLALDPLLHDPALVDWLAVLAATIEQTAKRDRAAFTDVLDPFERSRARAEVVSARLHALLPEEHLALDVAFGEGPIHLVGGRAAAVIEVRDGREGIRAEAGPGGLRLLQVRPDGDHPVGLVDGGTKRLVEAATRMTAATGVRPTAIVCLTGWEGSPQAVEGVLVCGPRSLADVIDALPSAPVDGQGLAAAARAVGGMPLPLPHVTNPGSLAHLLPVDVEDVPEALASLRGLVTEAHRAARSRAAGNVHASAA